MKLEDKENKKKETGGEEAGIEIEKDLLYGDEDDKEEPVKTETPRPSLAILNAPLIVEDVALSDPGQPKHFWSRVFRRDRTALRRDLDSIATQPSVFDNPDTLELYRPPASYENAHRFDPQARWTWREEQVKDTFIRICLNLFCLFVYYYYYYYYYLL